MSEPPADDSSALRDRIGAVLDALSPRDREALAAIVERDRSYGERAVRKERR